MISYPEELNIIFEKLKYSGIKAIIVGGFVRDSLLGIESKDIDIELYGVTSFTHLENILKEFGNVNVVGKSFGVCKLKFCDYDLDFSLPRRDNKVDSGHRGFDIKLYSNLDFKTAASRRDFTINAIGYDVEEKKILDPFGGTDDLRDKILRAVDLNSFIQDPLRVLRAAQFCARFNLEIEQNLFLTCRDMVSKNMLDELPKERIFEEIKKLLLKSRKPSIGFKLLKEFGTVFYTDNLDVVDEIAKQPTVNNQTNLVLMLAGLCYNFKQKDTEDFIIKLSDEKELLDRVIKLTRASSKIENIHVDNINSYLLYKLAAKVNIEELLILSGSIYFAKNNSEVYSGGEEIYKRAKELNILREKLLPLLNGKELLKFGLEPSPKFSEILNEAYEA
ncbi:MAG: CCA tRNA nucleotidyltransferase, partial [Sulfurimonas sp.]|nr:CCA tRNA nucleotidyltransferase [Sulfurimonas sp.]